MAGLVGVFGGTFDPPHLGHLLLASEGLIRLQLDKVLWVLTPLPPHKPDRVITAIDFRIRMVKQVVSRDEDFELSRVDIDRPPPHFALGTMQALRVTYPADEFVYLMGSDSLRDLPSWHRPLQFLDNCRFLGVLHRPGAEVNLEQLEKDLPGITMKVHYFSGPSLDIRGRDIRERVRVGLRHAHLLPQGVDEIIRECDLYR